MMSFESLADFIAMGGHGKYVWIAYGTAFVVIVLNVAVPILKRRQLVVKHSQQIKREALTNESSA